MVRVRQRQGDGENHAGSPPHEKNVGGAAEQHRHQREQHVTTHPQTKSLLVAYLLWGTLGLFGAHQFYLDRYIHGLLYVGTWGGFFLGWARDLFILPIYVKQANGDAVSRREAEIMAETGRAHFGVWVAAQYMFASHFRMSVLTALPYLGPVFVTPGLMPLLSIGIGGVVTAVVVFAIGNEGFREGPLKPALQWALIGEAVSWVLSSRVPSGSFFPCLLSIVAFFQHCYYRHPSQPKYRMMALQMDTNTVFAIGLAIFLLNFFTPHRNPAVDAVQDPWDSFDRVRSSVDFEFDV